ncbi:MAG: hypothetical protein AAF488_05825 [Planctomycetota bacterium]
MSHARSEAAGQESGVVLILAAVIMLGVGVIAVGSMEITLTHATYGATRLDRRAATAIAEGGIDVAYQTLNDNPAYRGTFTVNASTGASVQVTISENGSNLEIHTVASIGSVSRAVTAHLAPMADPDGGTTGEEFTVPVETSGKIQLDGATLEVIGGGALYGQIQEKKGGKAVGDFKPEASGALSVDVTALIRDADALLAVDELSPGVHRLGVTASNSHLTLRAPATIAGSLTVSGHLSIDGTGDMVLGSPESPITLVVGGKLDVLSSVSSLTVHGLIVVGSKIEVDGVPTVTGTGGLFSDRLFLNNTQVTWTFDPTILSVPAGVTGLPVSAASPTTYAEFWRQNVAK